MTVQSINRRVAQDTNMTPASATAAQGQSAAADAFASALQQAFRFGGATVGAPSAQKALSEPVSHAQVEERPEPVRAATQDNHAAERPKAKPAGHARTERGKDHGPAKAERAEPRDDTPVQANAGDAAPAATDDDTVAADQPQQAATTDEASQQQVAMQQQAEQAPAAPVQAAADQQGDADEGDDTDPFAWLDRAKARQDIAQKAQDAVQQGQNDTDAAGADAANQFGATLQAAAATAGTRSRHGAQDDGDAKADLARQQAADMAASLDDTGAQLKVNVTVNQPAAVDTAPMQAAAVAAETAQQLDAGQMQATTPSEQGQATGRQNAEISLAPAAPLPGTDASQAQQVADGKGQNAQSFAAALVQQADAGAKPVETASTQQQPIAGLTGVGTAQAAQKTSAPQAAQAPRAPRMVEPQQVVDQVSVEISKQVKDGADTIKIQLKPIELGKIEVKLDMAGDGTVQATITADRPETLAALQKDVKGLEKALGDAGLKLDSGAMSFNLRGGEQQAQRGQDDSPRQNGRGRSRLLSEVDPLGPVNPTPLRGLGGRSGVDIEV